MAAKLNPYVTFPGTAREAMDFYASVFGGTPAFDTFGGMGETDPALADKIMHASLEKASGFTLMASDTPPGMEHQPGGSISVSLSGDDADDLRSWWQQLSERGTVTMALEKQVWGDEFGMCVDPYGVSWMVNLAQPQG